MALISEYSNQSRCGFLIFFLVLVIIGMGGYIAYKEVYSDDVKTSKHREDNMAYVLRVYGDFFKTPEEQKKIEEKYFSDANNTVESPRKNDSVVSPEYYQRFCQNVTSTRFATSKSALDRKRRSSPSHRLVYHGCCVSHRSFVSPAKATSDHNGKKVELVYFDDGKRQYFLVDECWQTKTCSLGCGCRMQVGLFRALIHNDDYDPDDDDSQEPKYLVQTVRIGGSCKCMNNISP